MEVILYAAIIAFVFLPMHKKMIKGIPANVSAAFVTLLALVLGIVPVILLTRFILSNYNHISNLIAGGVVALESQFVQIESIFGSDVTAFFLNKISVYLFTSISNTAHLIIKIFVFAFLLFYFLRDHDKITNYISKLFKTIWKDEQVLPKIDAFLDSLLYGYFLTAIIIGILGGLFFWLLGYPYAIVIAVILGVTVLIPVLGTWTIGIPLAFYEFYTNDKPLLALTLVVVSIFLDSLKLYLLSRLGGNKARIHPALVMVGIIGGIYFFGLLGIIIGPITLGLLHILISHRFNI